MPICLSCSSIGIIWIGCLVEGSLEIIVDANEDGSCDYKSLNALTN